ncbi:Homoserine/homoserine lactone efflux protein [Pleomorphomonas sp. T1.2MG-36]|uniref:LysE family translocator n=1 Tax=Pleomorphomonas sp. T1.2MG-36 TaxID=3041167 RepID=UPI002477C09A|nr:LysE family translocator [Pleomorphomonas sp. T1.2MG-36]CAI9415857.1 Homoserine/homoserine lactone efflux protein [Pleomorphomonas sp. T1.2MG-36]
MGLVDFWMFAGALAIAYLVPGPDMVLILQTGLLRGRAHALAVAAGLAAARATHVLLAAAGLAALLRTMPAAFDVVRVAGAAYLVWLGLDILRSSSSASGLSGPAASDEERSWSRAAMRGLLTNLLNPKALLFCSVLLPQFVRPESGSVPGQFAVLGTILVAIGLMFDFVYAGAGATLSRWAGQYPLAQHLQRWAFAALLVGFGLRLALSQRPL